MSFYKALPVRSVRVLLPFACAVLSGCLSPDAISLGATEPGSGPTVVFDVFHKPFPDIPLPNDFATTYDATSPTLRRLNASISAGPTAWEQATRRELDKLSGWGLMAPIAVGFSEPIDPEIIFARHHRDELDFSNDAVLVINITPGSPGYCEAVPLDLGQGNFPQVLQETKVFEADPREGIATLTFEEVEEDLNGNGVLDPGEDTDMDGVLDHPNTRDGKVGSQLLEFYERETNTLIMKPMMPMREATTYATVLTKRLTSPSGAPVRSPFANINDTSQTEALAALPSCLDRYGLGTYDIGFTWTFTTQSVTHDIKKMRDGLYGLGPLAQLGAAFPASLTTLRDLRDAGPSVTNTKVVPHDVFLPIMEELYAAIGNSTTQIDVFRKSFEAVDYIVGGDIQSPQMFPRDDANGNRLPLYDQVWDLAAPARPETIPFWMFVPKNRKGPAPVAYFIHGHGSCKFDTLLIAGILANYGMATVGFEAPGHNCSVKPELKEVALVLFKKHGVSGLGNVILDGRGLDWNGDGQPDSGADYWTSYIFHTRDNVRQTMVDLMQLIRVMRSFDGKQQWAYDPAQKGAPGLAGDFDGDGVVDVGGKFFALGGSLGGIASAVAAGVEPALESVVALLPGGTLGEIGPRSTLAGVKAGMMLRAMGPVFFAKDDKLMVQINDAQTDELTLAVQNLPKRAPKDTVVLLNQKTGEYRCGVVQASGNFRVTVSSDEGSELAFRIYKGPLPPRTPEGCEIGGAEPYVELRTFGEDVKYSGKTFAKGSTLVALTDGFGQRRTTPDFRRFLGMAQIGVDAADPMNFAPFWNGTRELTYSTGETVNTRVIIMPSAGDPGVPVATGIALGRAGGFIKYDEVDPRYGKSQNQTLIDSWAVEGIPRTARYHDSKGNPVVMDVDHFAAVVPVDDGYDVPRLDPPLRLVHDDHKGGFAGFMLPMIEPAGLHGFPALDPQKSFDLGLYLLNITGRYLQSSGTAFSYDKCQADGTCVWPSTSLK